MKIILSTILKLFLAAIAGLALCVSAAEAADRGKGGRGSWDFSVPLNYTGSSTTNGQNGSSANVNAALSMGFGLGYNVNDHFQVNGQFMWSERNYSATTTGGKIAGGGNNYVGTLYTSSLQLNVVYYFMAGNFTPFVQGGIGTTYIDSNIPAGNASNTCYWDPFYGYVCGTYQPTKSSNNISYSAGVGARYDVSKAFALQGSYNTGYIDAPQAGSKSSFDLIRLDFIFRM
jgi:opacity protein-like surface antigen